MIIDLHTHPIFIDEILNREQEEDKRNIIGLYKAAITPLSLHIKQMDAAGIDREVLLPLDTSSQSGGVVALTNEDTHKLVQLLPDRFIGFASVDPHNKDAPDILENAVKRLKLRGLKLNPSSQGFLPDDFKIMSPIYEKVCKLDIPILFHAGMTWEPCANSQNSHPARFEAVALKYPKLRFCLAHFAWPWSVEAAMLALKYPNVYIDTSLLYFDSPVEFFKHMFTNVIPHTWVDRTLSKKIMFGSNYPRIEQVRMREALESVGFKQQTLKRILGDNACEFIGL